ncbi:MAG: FecCD family ABC transporter permease [Coriobacteriales bacterium]|jgi:iron complex transport system permease protein
MTVETHQGRAGAGRSRRKTGLAMTLIIISPFVCVLVAMCFGRYAVSISDVLGSIPLAFQTLGATIFDPSSQPVLTTSQTLVITSRMPRALAAAAVGAALAIAGAAFQGVFRNPLVDSGMLGVSNGAGFGAALAIVFFGGGAMIYPMAFLFGVLAVALSYWIARVYRSTPTIMLVLGGVVVSSVFSALISLMKYIADPTTQLPSIVYWLMGSLASVSWEDFWAVIAIVIGCVMLFCCSWRIDVLSMGDKEARSLGVEVNRTKGIIVCGATLSTAGAICMAGSVGWVGLVIPHIARMIVGSESKRLLPASVALGASFMVIVDTCARCIWASEVPLGILTALIGAPFFVYLLKKTRGGGW